MIGNTWSCQTHFSILLLKPLSLIGDIAIDFFMYLKNSRIHNKKCSNEKLKQWWNCLARVSFTKSQKYDPNPKYILTVHFQDGWTCQNEFGWARQVIEEPPWCFPGILMECLNNTFNFPLSISICNVYKCGLSSDWSSGKIQ